MARRNHLIRVLIADDHPVVLEGLRTLISPRRNMKVIAEAASGREAVDRCMRYKPDIALIDLRMPDMDGIEVLQLIRSRVPSTRNIVLTTYAGDEDIYRALRAGAKAYLLKDARPDELLGCIRAVYEGQTWMSSVAAAKLAARLNTSTLTSRELDVLRMMVAGRSNKEIGSAFHIAEGTVKIHVNRILKKLAVSGRTEAVSQALKRGLVHLA